VKTTESSEDDTLCNTMKSHYVTAWRCAKKRKFTASALSLRSGRNEPIYLTFHIERITKVMAALTKGATESGTPN